MAIQLSDHFTYFKLFRFTLPSATMMIFTSIYTVVDGLFVSNFVGDLALAAVIIAVPLIMIVGAFGFMLGTGGSAEVARAMGEGEGEKAKQYFTTIILAVLIGGAALTGLCLALLGPLLRLLGASEALMADCITYGTIMLAGAPICLLQASLQSFLVAAERPKLGLWLTVGAGLTNMVLDYVLIGVLGWGVAGAAWATVWGYAVGGIVPLIYFLLPNKSPLRLVRTHLYPRMLLKSCGNGSSELLTNISISVVSVLYNRALMEAMGEAGVAAWSVMMYVDFFFAAAFIGFSMGVAPVFSYQYGAGNHDELKSLFSKCMRVILGLSLAMMALSQLLNGALTGVFVGYDADLWSMTSAGFRVFALVYLFAGWNIFGSAFFTSLGDGVTSAILSVLRTLVFQCGAILLLPRFFGLNGIWWATVLAQAAACAVTAWFWVKKRDVYYYA